LGIRSCLKTNITSFFSVYLMNYFILNTHIF